MIGNTEDYNVREDSKKDKRSRTEKPMYEEFANKYFGPQTDSAPGRAYPKAKAAILMGYCGLGYSGMQINANVNTIELELHRALGLSKAVSRQNVFSPNKMSFMRAARTDKGVHALGQVCSLRVEKIPNIVEKINEHLPEQIRVWDVVYVTKSFNSKNMCDSRVYEYFMPTYPFTKQSYIFSNESNGSKDQNVDGRQRESQNFNEPQNANEPQNVNEPRDPTSEEIKKFAEFRLSESDFLKIKQITKAFIGTNNFYSYTVNKNFSDPSAIRHIIDFTCSEPQIRNGMEWIKFTVHGQSFMLQQIRKMVGMLIMIVRARASEKVVLSSFKGIKFNIPKAPGVGLLLDRAVFSGYNARVKISKGSASSCIIFDKYEKEIFAFKEKHIYSQIVQSEKNCFDYFKWLQCVESRISEYMWFLTESGNPDLSLRPAYMPPAEVP